MYVAPPQGSYEGRAGEYFQAVCVKGGDVLEDEGCFCAGVATPMLGGGNVCEMKDGAAWCWTAPGTCADGEHSRLLRSLSRWAVCPAVPDALALCCRYKRGRSRHPWLRLRRLTHGLR